MSPKTRNRVLIVVIAAFVLLGVLSYVLFTAGGSAPDEESRSPGKRTVFEPRR